MADTAGLLAQWDERLQALAKLPQQAREAQRQQFAQTAVRAWAGKNGLNIPSTEKWFLDTTAQGPVRAPFPKTAVALTAGVGTLLEPLANVAGMERTAGVLRGQQETAVERARRAGTSDFGIGAAQMGGTLAGMLPVYAKAASVASAGARALPKLLPGAFGLASGKAAVLARELPQIESRVAVAKKVLDTVGVGIVEGAHAAAMAKDGDRVGHAVEGFLEGSAFMTGLHALGAGARGLRSALRSRHGFSEAQAGAVDDVARFGEQGVDAGTLAQARAAVAQSGPDAVSKTIFGYTEQVALAADRAGFPRRAPVVEPVGSKLRVNMRGPNGESYVAGDTRGVDASQAEFLLKRIGQYLKQGYHVEGVDGDREAIHAFYSALEKIHEPVYQRLLPAAPAAKAAKGGRPGPVAVPKPAAAPEGTQLPVFLAGGSVRIPGVDGKPIVFPHVDAALKDVRSRADGAGKRLLERELAKDRKGNGKGVLARLRHEATVAGYEFEALPGGGYAFMKAGVQPGAGASRKVFKGLDDAVAFADENLREPLTTPELVDMAMVNPAFRRVAVSHLAGDVLPPSGGRPVTTVPGGPEVFELPKSGVSVATFYTRPFYAWLNSWSVKNARPDVYKVFRDADSAQLQRDQFAIPYAKVVREVFRGVKPSRRHDLYRYLEAADADRAGLAEQLKLSGDEIGRLDRVRREFFDPLFQEFGFDAQQFIRNYAPRVRRDLEVAGAARNPDVYLARGGDSVPGAEFWAEQARTGALDVYDTDLQRVMLAYLRQGSLKKFLGPHFERMESVANELVPGTEQFKVGAVRDHLLRQAQFMRGMPDKSQRVLDGFVGGTIDGINGMIEQANKALPKAARLEKIDTPPREVLANLIATQYAGALGLRAMVPIRDATPLFLSAYPVLGGRYLALGMAKATQLKDAVRVANHYGALLRSGDLRSFYTAERASAGGVVSKAREAMLDSLSWGDNVVRLVSFWSGHAKALDAMKGFAGHRDPKRLARESGLWLVDSLERDRFLAEAAKASPDKWSDIAFRMSRELVETVNPRIRRGAEPGMSKFAVGRIFGMYGTWPLNHVEYLRRLGAAMGDADYRGEASKALARAAVSHSAVVSAGAAAGVDVGQWVFTAPGAWGAGGPLQALLNAPDAVLNWQSERGTEARRDIARLLPVTLDDDGTPALGTGFPGGLSLSRTLRAYRERDPEFFKIALGFTPLKERDKQRFPYTVIPDVSELGEDAE